MSTTATERPIEWQGSPSSEFTPKWDSYEPGKNITCVAIIAKENEGYSAHSVNLPGVASQGETIKEVLRNLREAFDLAIDTYHQEGMTIPWVPWTEWASGLVLEKNERRYLL